MELAPIGLAPRAHAFYARTLAVLNETKIPFLVESAYALAEHAGIERHTKDLDIFVHARDRDAVLRGSMRPAFTPRSRSRTGSPRLLATTALLT